MWFISNPNQSLTHNIIIMKLSSGLTQMKIRKLFFNHRHFIEEHYALLFPCNYAHNYWWLTYRIMYYQDNFLKCIMRDSKLSLVFTKKRVELVPRSNAPTRAPCFPGVDMISVYVWILISYELFTRNRKCYRETINLMFIGTICNTCSFFFPVSK